MYYKKRTSKIRLISTGEMLIQSTLPSSIEVALSFASDHCKQDLLCDWLPSGGTKLKCPKCEECPWDCCRECITSKEEKENVADSHILVYSKNCSKLSSGSNMCANPTPSLVYKRRKLQSNSVTLLCSEAAKNTKGNGGCHSNMISKAPFLPSEKDHFGIKIANEIGIVRVPAMAIDVCDKDILCSPSTALAVTPGVCSENRLSSRNRSVYEQIYLQKLDCVPCTEIKNTECVETFSKLESSNNLSGKEQQLETLNKNIHKPGLMCDNMNDSCSSSKSNMEYGSASLRTDTDETGECSSSDILTKELMEESVSEKEFCISLLRNFGLLEAVLPARSCPSVDVLVRNCDNNQSLACRICGDSENPLDMLICDNCEDAFHVSCCNPRIKKIPVGEWYCQPCSAKRHKLPQETATAKSSNAKNGVPECRNRTSKSGLSPIEFMLKDPEPYTAGVRIGKAFQAEVPEWSGPISDDFSCFGEPLEMDPTECGCLYGLTTIKPSSNNSIGNWLQCREILDDSTGLNPEGTLCGKWRRAPLFEVQTNDWDCSCAIRWDPFHSDCAVPQELETAQVLMHLKYIELLRPRLAAKKKKHNLPKTCAENTKHGNDS